MCHTRVERTVTVMLRVSHENVRKLAMMLQRSHSNGTDDDKLHLKLTLRGPHPRMG
jgi:hypothetical protein